MSKSYKGFTITNKSNICASVNIFDCDGYWCGEASNRKAAERAIDDAKGE